MKQSNVVASGGRNGRRAAFCRDLVPSEIGGVRAVALPRVAKPEVAQPRAPHARAPRHASLRDCVGRWGPPPSLAALCEAICFVVVASAAVASSRPEAARPSPLARTCLMTQPTTFPDAASADVGDGETSPMRLVGLRALVAPAELGQHMDQQSALRGTPPPAGARISAFELTDRSDFCSSPFEARCLCESVAVCGSAHLRPTVQFEE